LKYIESWLMDLAAWRRIDFDIPRMVVSAWGLGVFNEADELEIKSIGNKS
jgi:hypothetical protein